MATISEALAIAVQHHQAGRLQTAEQIYRQILAAAPNQADAWHLLGVINGQTGNHQRSVEYISRALMVKPDWAEAQANLGNALREQGKLDAAVASYRRAVELKPDFAEAHYNLGNVLKDQGKLDEAVAFYRRAVELRPDFAEADYNLGNALKDQGKLDEAIACYRLALKLNPQYAEAHVNLAIALGRQDKVDEVVACCRRVVELKPDFDEAHYNLAVALKDQGKPGEAIACYRRALELTPDFAQAHLNQSMMLLLTGDFERGWAEYQWRWKTATCPPRHYSKAFWDGQPLEGRAIFLYAEQGLGDAIQFVRYVALVKQRGGTVIVGCQGPLLSLFQSCGGIDRLLRKGDQLPALDIQASLESLPGIFHTALDDLPATVPYLFADPALVDRWRQELRHLAGFKIGIAWRGNPRHENDRNRSIPLGCFEPLVRCGGVRLLSLQKGAGVEQLQSLAQRFPITELGSRLNDFMDTAAVMMNLDLLITCDTAVAHLAGALGVPVWIAIPFVPDWRWLLDRSDSPWYPTMRLFRQESRGDWQGVFRRIAAALDEHLASRVIRPGGES